jgi:phosphocarrier protein HPr
VTAEGRAAGSGQDASMEDVTASAAVTLVNALGLHARPSVKLTKLAKTFASQIEIAPEAEGPWIDAKSIVKVMAIKAKEGAILQFRAKGPDATEAIAALHALLAGGFAEDTEPGQEAEQLNG